VVLAHLQTRATRQDPQGRKSWKTRLVKGLFERGLDAETIRQLFRVIDWIMDLPREWELEFSKEIHQFQEERKMPYITSVERLAMEKGEAIGLRKGITSILKVRFGASGIALISAFEGIEDLTRLHAIQAAAENAISIEDVSKLVN
jgi:hypothetical protein